MEFAHFSGVINQRENLFHLGSRKRVIELVLIGLKRLSPVSADLAIEKFSAVSNFMILGFQRFYLIKRSKRSVMNCEALPAF